MFFLGFRNALFVGFAIPMSMLMSFVVIGFLGETINTMVLFGLIMGLGMLVDIGIVVVENAYRLMEKDKMNSIEAAKKGFTIATNDKEILTKLKLLKINALKIREKTKLVSTEGI